MCFSSSYSATGCPVIGLEPFFRVCVGMGREWETKLKLALAMAHMNDAEAIMQQACRKEQGCANVLELLRYQEYQARLQVHLCRRDTNAEAASAVAPAEAPEALAVARTNLARARDKHRAAVDDHLGAKEQRISAECYEQRATGKLRKAQQWWNDGSEATFCSGIYSHLYSFAGYSSHSARLLTAKMARVPYVCCGILGHWTFFQYNGCLFANKDN